MTDTPEWLQLQETQKELKIAKIELSVLQHKLRVANKNLEDFNDLISQITRILQDYR